MSTVLSLSMLELQFCSHSAPTVMVRFKYPVTPWQGRPFEHKSFPMMATFKPFRLTHPPALLPSLQFLRKEGRRWRIFPEKSGTGPSGRTGCGYINRCLYLRSVSFKAHGCLFCPSLRPTASLSDSPYYMACKVHIGQVSEKEAEVMYWPLYCRDGGEDDLPVLTPTPPTGLL